MALTFFGSKKSGGGGTLGGPTDGGEAAMRAMLEEVRAYWQGLRVGDALPLRDQIDPRGLRGALHGAFLIERIAPGIGRLRIAGMNFTDLLGMDGRGMPLSALFDPMSRARLGTLLDAWKSAQRSGARIDRPTEDSLWKRFSHARTAFDKARRTHFADLDRRNGEARSVKDELVAKAEALAGSTDWGPTGSAFRDLMDAWRVAPRGSRKEDDALWARFKGAQDTFFGARTKANELIDSEYGANLEVKNELLVRAEALLPINDLASVKRSLRDIQDAWDAAGKVPRAAVQSTEARLRAVEQAVRDAEQAEYRRSDPEVKARVEGATAQLLDSITALEAEIAAAEAAGKSKEAAKAKDALATKQQWLEIVRRAES